MIMKGRQRTPPHQMKLASSTLYLMKINQVCMFIMRRVPPDAGTCGLSTETRYLIPGLLAEPTSPPALISTLNMHIWKKKRERATVTSQQTG